MHSAHRDNATTQLVIWSNKDRWRLNNGLPFLDNLQADELEKTPNIYVYTKFMAQHWIYRVACWSSS